MESSLKELAEYRLARAKEMLSAAESNYFGQESVGNYKKHFVLPGKVRL